MRSSFARHVRARPLALWIAVLVAGALLVTASPFCGSLGLYDALGGEFIGRVAGTGFTIDLLQAPWRAEGAR